jgi:hypothetical protein
MTIAHPAMMLVEVAALVKLTVPCGGTVNLSVDAAPVPN